MRKRVGKLVNWINNNGYNPIALGYSAQISRELYELFGTDKQTRNDFLDDMCPRITYSYIERKDIFAAYNWMLERAADVGVTIIPRELCEFWSDSLDEYIQSWNDHHRDEIQEWQQQPRQIMLKAFAGLDQIVRGG